MATELLSDLKIKNATVEPGKTIRKLHDGNGLYLWVYADGAKAWRYRFYTPVVSADDPNKTDLKERSLSLGTYPAVSLAAARKRVQELREQHQTGVDPGAERKRQKRETAIAASNTFKVVAEEWFSKQKPGWVESHAVDVRRRLDANLYPVLGARPLSEIDPPELLAAVRKIEARGAHDLAHRVLGVAGQVFRYGVATGKCTADVSRDLKGALTVPVKKNQASIEPKDLPTLLRAIYRYTDDGGERSTQLGLVMLCLTFTRTTELIGAKKSEFDLDDGLWSIPGERMKNKLPFLVPLATQTIEVLEALFTLSGDSEYLLPGRNPQKPISNNTLLFALYRLGYKGRMTGHGFRAIASTVLNESNLFEPDWIERQLAHVPENQVRSAYNRAEYLTHRIKMMQWWADEVSNAVSIGGLSCLPGLE
jgi:integrase